MLSHIYFAFIRASNLFIDSLWHPIVEPVEQQPLCLCDYRTAKTDTFPADLVYPHIASENQLIRYSEEQQWYYIDNQKIGEAWIFKQVDSEALINPEISGCELTYS